MADGASTKEVDDLINRASGKREADDDETFDEFDEDKIVGREAEDEDYTDLDERKIRRRTVRPRENRAMALVRGSAPPASSSSPAWNLAHAREHARTQQGQGATVKQEPVDGFEPVAAPESKATKDARALLARSASPLDAKPIRRAVDTVLWEAITPAKLLEDTGIVAAPARVRIPRRPVDMAPTRGSRAPAIVPVAPEPAAAPKRPAEIPTGDIEAPKTQAEVVEEHLRKKRQKKKPIPVLEEEQPQSAPDPARAPAAPAIVPVVQPADNLAPGQRRGKAVVVRPPPRARKGGVDSFRRGSGTYDERDRFLDGMPPSPKGPRVKYSSKFVLH